MLSTLRVRNFILIDRLELELGPGFNVLTGETGAGKSIVVGALNLVLGGRATTDVIRDGEGEAEVEALIDVRGLERLLAQLDAAGIATEGGELVVRRVVTSGGRSRAYLNGRLCTAAELLKLAPDLADVASQHESVALTDPATHLGYLDRFAHLVEARGEIAAQVARIEEVMDRLRAARDAERGRGEREAFVAFQLRAIDALAPRAGEIEELGVERNRLRHATRLAEITRRAAGRLVDGDDTLVDELARIVKELHSAAEIDPSLGPSAASLEGAFASLSDAARDLSRYAERAEADPARLGEIEDRLYRLEGLVRQHGPTLEHVLATRERLAAELDAFATAETRVAELEKERDALLATAAEHAKKLSRERKKAADKLGRAISTELAELGMGGAKVVVDVAPLSGAERTDLAVDGARLGADGIDRVEFLIAPNKGIEPRPLRKIASGGELSRALLALKRSLADSGPAGLYVFDEVDAGVGGAVAEKIGRAIADVARHRQVLCITHLAPIAAFADAHYVVSKAADGRITKSTVVRVESKERVGEIARMLTGAKVTPAAMQAASELLRAARTS